MYSADIKCNKFKKGPRIVKEKILLNKVMDNSYYLADMLESNISISQDITRCGAVKLLYMALRNNLGTNDLNSVKEGIKIFEIHRDDFNNSLLKFNKLKSELNDLSTCIADHPFTIKSGNKIIGCGWSPYLNQSYLSDPHILYKIKSSILDMMAYMSNEFYDKYEVLILPTDRALYQPGYAISIVFLKREYL